MKFLVIMLSSLLSVSAMAEEIKIKVPKGFNASRVILTNTIMQSGCSNSTVNLPVIRSRDLDAYVAGFDETISQSGRQINNSRGGITCMAMVDKTYQVSFAVYSDQDGFVTVLVPDLKGPWTTKVTPLPAVQPSPFNRGSAVEL